METFYFNHVCIIEDSEADLLLLRNLIKISSFSREITVFQQPEEALKWFKSLVPNRTHLFPELIFLDLNMPVLTGFELIEKMERELPGKLSRKMQFAITTSSSHAEDIIRSTIYRSVIAYLIKPISPKILHPSRFLNLKEEYFREKNRVV